MLKVPGNVHLALQKALLFRSCLFRGKNFDYFCSENLQVWDYPVIWKVPSALDSNDAISFEEYVSWQLLHSDTRKKMTFFTQRGWTLHAKDYSGNISNSEEEIFFGNHGNCNIFISIFYAK